MVGRGGACSSVVLCLGDGHLTNLIVAVVCFLVEKVLGIFLNNILFLGKDFVLITITIALLLKQTLNVLISLNKDPKYCGDGGRRLNFSSLKQRELQDDENFTRSHLQRALI